MHTTRLNLMPPARVARRISPGSTLRSVSTRPDDAELTVGAKSRACPCGGGCPRCKAAKSQPIQRNASVSVPGDAFEREADEVADKVLRMTEPAGPAAAATSPPHAGRAAAQLESRQDLPLPVVQLASIGGRPLPRDLRAYFEPRFGLDFSQIRVHTDGQAVRAAQAVQARAYTSGRDIVFGAGEYAPGTAQGRRLLAHELTHVVQQGGGATPAIQRDAREGTATLEDQMVGTPGQSGGIWRGSVRRDWVAPASGSSARQVMSSATVPVEFDPAACAVTLRHRYAFVAGEPGPASTSGICDEPARPATVPPLPAARLNEIRTSYLDAVNTGLRDWYSVRFAETSCESPCTGRDIPINVVAELAGAGAAADTTITVVNRDGRADAATICAGSFNTNTVVHEGGHQVLGAGDEYAEDDPAVLRQSPAWGRPERVYRSDFSRMGEHHDYGRFSLFQRRHFEHVPLFLRSLFPSCTPHLVELSRPVVPDFRVGIAGGYARLGEANTGFVDVGLGLGFPLSRLRTWELTTSLHGEYLFQAGIHGQQAFLLGARVGLEHTGSASAGGLRVGAFAEGGAGWFNPGAPGGATGPGAGPGWSAAPWAGVGLGAGYRFSAEIPVTVGAEFGLGSTLTAVPGASGLPSDEHTLRWFQAGLRLGIDL